jgi:arylsulfatase A-like enzyme
LVAQSFVFESAIAQAPWTTPAVASLLTGLLPQQHGATGVGRHQALAPDALTLAEILKTAGFRTAAFVSNGNTGSDFGFDQGFDTFREPYRSDPAVSAAHLHELALQWLDAEAARAPFFVLVHVIEPHAPYRPPDDLRRRFAPDVVDPAIGGMKTVTRLSMLQDGPSAEQLRDLQSLYDAEVASLDRQFQAFLASLSSRNLLEPTLFVFVADHGEEFWEHGSLTHGSRLNAEQLRVPLFVRFPGGTRRGRTTQWVQQIDVLPTVLDFFAIEPPVTRPARTGRSLLSAVRGEPLPDTPLLSHLELDVWRATSVLWGNRKLVRTEAGFWGTRTELYDLAADPLELANLATTRSIEAEWLLTFLHPGRIGAFLAPRDAPISPEAEQQLRALGYIR